MMREFFVFMLLFCLLGACSSTTVEEVDVYEMVGSSASKQKTLETFTDPEFVDIFVMAIKSAVKEPGIVDMIDPEYQVKVEGKTYFLWIDKDSGTIMDSKDTHTIYSLSKESAKKIYDMLN